MIRAKKSLGQNFLIDKNIIKKIVNTTNVKDKIILEIGPGTGNLTSEILIKSPKKIYVIEKDKSLVSYLKKNFEKDLDIINEDVLNFNEKSLTSEKIIVFGNLPYNISTEILCKWILNLKEKNYWFESLILMFQKEVADRIISKYNSKNYGRLSILANWRLNVKKICDIKPDCFFPKPKVESTLLLFSPKIKYFKIKDPRNLEKITRIFFNQRRKMIKKPYNQLFSGNQKVIEKLGLNLNLRPQNLKLNDYYEIAREYEELWS